MTNKIKLLHVTTGLSTGGAETTLYKMLSCMDREAFEAEVISLTGVGSVGEKIHALGVPVRALGMRRGASSPLSLLAFTRLARLIRTSRPDVVQTWMYHADLLGGLAARLSGATRVAWNVRHSDLDARRNKRTTIWTARACARLSSLIPDRIVCCAEVAREVHEALGYDPGKTLVIPNGFDPRKFRPDPEARRSVRQELGIPEAAPVVGMVARFNPDKDHYNFVCAAALLHKRKSETRFLLCGDGASWENRELAKWIEQAGLRDSLLLLGRRTDMPRLTASLDIATSSSSSEGFSNVVGEAMACGVSCVVTDVGDSARIVGGTGIVVPPKDPEALAAGWSKMLERSPKERRELGASAKKRVEENYSLERVTKAYEAMYRELASNNPRSRP